MKILKPLTSMKGNTVYVNYIQDENPKYITIEPGCAGWEFDPIQFGINRYNLPKYKGWQVKIIMKVDNTQGFVSDYISPLDYKPDFVNSSANHPDIY